MQAHRLAPLSLVLTLCACGPDAAINFEVYRAGADDELELVSKGCVASEAGGAVGGGNADYASSYEDAGGGAMQITYFAAPEGRSGEGLVEEDDDDVEIVAQLELSKEDLLSGEIHMLAFERDDGVHFEALHWGSQGCE